LVFFFFHLSGFFYPFYIAGFSSFLLWAPFPVVINDIFKARDLCLPMVDFSAFFFFSSARSESRFDSVLLVASDYSGIVFVALAGPI